MTEVLHVGDKMRMSVEFVDLLKADYTDNTLTVRVANIVREQDGTVTIWLENDEDVDEVVH